MLSLSYYMDNLLYRLGDEFGGISQISVHNSNNNNNNNIGSYHISTQNDKIHLHADDIIFYSPTYRMKYKHLSEKRRPNAGYKRPLINVNDLYDISRYSIGPQTVIYNCNSSPKNSSIKIERANNRAQRKRSSSCAIPFRMQIADDYVAQCRFDKYTRIDNAQVAEIMNSKRSSIEFLPLAGRCACGKLTVYR